LADADERFLKSDAHGSNRRDGRKSQNAMSESQVEEWRLWSSFSVHTMFILEIRGIVDLAHQLIDLDVG
jgi:hypothetical protein